MSTIYETIAERIVPEYERDTLGDWPRFATEESVCDLARQNTVDALAAALERVGLTDVDGADEAEWLDAVEAAWCDRCENLAINWDAVAAAIIDDEEDAAAIRAAVAWA